jgi:hypothetical protein
MKTVLKDSFVDGWLDQGSLRKARQLLLELLAMRLDVPEDIRERVETCTDEALLDKWFTRAVNAETLDEVFAD